MKPKERAVLERCIEEALSSYFANRINDHGHRVQYVREDYATGELTPLKDDESIRMRRDLAEEAATYVMNEIDLWFDYDEVQE